MDQQELVQDALIHLGYRPSIDSDGDIKFRHKMRTYYVQLGKEQEDEPQFATLLLPNFAIVDENQISTTLLVCNKAVRNLKMVKVYVDEELSYVHASCEFFYHDSDALFENLECSMRILSVIPVWYRDCIQELSE